MSYPELIQRLYAFNDWANARYFAAVAELDEEAVTRVIPSSFPSIHATFAHIVSGEWIWLRRWLGESPTAPPPWMAEAGLGVLRARLQDIEMERRRFLETLDESRLNAVTHFRLLSGKSGSAPLVELLLHVVNHSTYHRGQLATLFRQVGATPPATDLMIFASPLS